MICSLAGVIEEVNDAYCAMSGHARAELIDKPLDLIDGADSACGFGQRISALAESHGYDRFECRLHRKDSSGFDVEVTLLHLDGKDQEGVALLMRDISEITYRRRAEASLVRAKELSDSLTRIGDAIHSTHDFLEIACRLVAEGAHSLGCDTAALSRRLPEGWVVFCTHNLPDTLLGAVTDDEQERHAALAVRTGEPIAIVDVANDSRVNREHVMEHGIRSVLTVPLIAGGDALGALFFNYHGAPHQFSTCEVDFAQQLGTTASIALQNARLYRERQRAEEALVEADRRKTEFLAVLSHELRNPLTPITNSLYILDHAPPVGEQADRARQVIARQVTQLASLVNDLLDVSRITRNKVRLRTERLDLVDVVRRTVEDCRSFFDKAEVHLELEALPAPLFVVADRVRVAQIVGNLLQNASKFTPKGGLTRISVLAEGDDAVVRVADNGAGITAETLAHLFQPFIQADHTLDRSRGGLGLGLALVKGLVDLHGGTVVAHSEGLGKGAELVVRLPLDTLPPQPSVATIASVTKRKRKILIIEDNVDAAESLGEVLRIEGHEVEVAYCGPEGIAKARRMIPDVVLCDIGLPGMDGFEVAKELRAEASLGRTLLVALSGYALAEDRKRAAEAGFARHLAKPPDLQSLCKLLADPDLAASGFSTSSEDGVILRG